MQIAGHLRRHGRAGDSTLHNTRFPSVSPFSKAGSSQECSIVLISVTQGGRDRTNKLQLSLCGYAVQPRRVRVIVDNPYSNLVPISKAEIAKIDCLNKITGLHCFVQRYERQKQRYKYDQSPLYYLYPDTTPHVAAGDYCCVINNRIQRRHYCPYIIKSYSSPTVEPMAILPQHPPPFRMARSRCPVEVIVRLSLFSFPEGCHTS